MLHASYYNDVQCSTRWLRPFAQAMDELGLDSRREFATIGIDSTQLGEREFWVSHSSVVALLERTNDITKGGVLGARAAECLRRGELDVLEYAAGACSTLGEALECVTRYIQLLHGGARLSIVRAQDRSAIAYDCGGLEVAAAGSEFVLSALVSIGRRLSGQAMPPLEVTFQHQRPANTKALEALFQTSLRFGCELNAVWMEGWPLDIRISQGEPQLRSILERHAKTLLERVPRQRTFKQRVLELIAEELTTGNPGVDNLAHRLHVSPRTFLRRLKAEQTTHRELVNCVRKQLAQRYLEDGDTPLSEISYILGFSSSNAFHKAFRHWHGTTPTEYRRRMAARRSGVPREVCTPSGLSSLN